MKDNELKLFLRQSLQQEVQHQRLEETVKLCAGIVRKESVAAKEPRIGFFEYLSDVFRVEGAPVLGLQAVTLFIVCLSIFNIADVPKNIPVFIPLFVLSVMPVIFRSQLYGMSELEAATRASGAQIILAKLILAGAANLICMTVLFCMEVWRWDLGEEMGQIALYCLVPYLVCMVTLLRLTRLRSRMGIRICAVLMPAFCVCWGLSARVLPWLYEASATGLWAAAFFVSGAFFVKEVHFIIKTGKEGKMYGIIA